MSDLTRRERIRSVLIDEYTRDGHQIVVLEGETYARLVEETKRGAIVLADINLDTLADQIDRRV